VDDGATGDVNGDCKEEQKAPATLAGDDAVTFQFSSRLRGSVEIYNANFYKVL